MRNSNSFPVTRNHLNLFRVNAMETLESPLSKVFFCKILLLVLMLLSFRAKFKKNFLLLPWNTIISFLDTFTLLMEVGSRFIINFFHRNSCTLYFSLMVFQFLTKHCHFNRVWEALYFILIQISVPDQTKP